MLARAWRSIAGRLKVGTTTEMRRFGVMPVNGRSSGKGASS
jgi:hypothetical protein